MEKVTFEVIKNIIAIDRTITPDDAQAILERFKQVHNPRPGTIKQAAEILDVHPVTIRRYAQAGLLTPIRITARNVHYDLNEVEELANTGHSTQEKEK